MVFIIADYWVSINENKKKQLISESAAFSIFTAFLKML